MYSNSLIGLFIVSGCRNLHRDTKLMLNDVMSEALSSKHQGCRLCSFQRIEARIHLYLYTLCGCQARVIYDYHSRVYKYVAYA
jgi:hypothetical protein